MRYLITGATGFVGGHIAEACRQRGRDITALVRPTSDTRLLEDWGVDILRGELTDAALVRRALEDVEVVIHCAAKVGDWGPVDEYRRANVENLRVLLDGCKGLALSRFVHLSTLGVYPLRHQHGTDETTPPAKKHRDGYSQSKVEAEKLALDYYRDFGVPVVVLRPGFIYGPRDRQVLPRLVESLRRGRVRYPGGGRQRLNTIFVGNLVEAVWLAAHNDHAVGQVYNLTDGEPVTKRDFVEAVADSLGLPRPTSTPPLWVVWLATLACERWARLRGKKEAPFLNTASYKFMALDLDFSIEKAKFELIYQPRWSFKDAIEETLAWFKTCGADFQSAR